MLTLFHSPQSRSTRFLWLLEELGAEYEVEYVTIPRTDGSGAPDPKNPHPEKKVPALLHDGHLVTESVAVALYLTDLFPDKGIGVPVGDPERGAYLSWLVWYSSELEPAIVAKFTGATDTNPMLARAYDQVCARLVRTLEERDYVLGDRFTAADILIGSAFQWIPDLLPKGPAIDAYVARLNARPALAAGAAKDAAPAAA